MPLSNSTLKSLIKSHIITETGSPTADADLEKFCKALADAIVEHIVAAALVTGTVTSGAGTGGAVTGTIS